MLTINVSMFHVPISLCGFINCEFSIVNLEFAGVVMNRMGGLVYYLFLF